MPTEGAKPEQPKNPVVSTETTPNELKESGELDEDTQMNHSPESSIVNFNAVSSPDDQIAKQNTLATRGEAQEEHLNEGRAL